MIRAVFGEALLFLVPCVLFALFLVIQRRNPLLWSHWSGPSFYLTAAGLGLVVVSFIVGGITAERREGPFEPTHLENGRVVPGRFQ